MSPTLLTLLYFIVGAIIAFLHGPAFVDFIQRHFYIHMNPGRSETEWVEYHFWGVVLGLFFWPLLAVWFLYNIVITGLVSLRRKWLKHFAPDEGGPW